MAETQLHHPWGISELNLYPPEPGSSFRAWDAADELILDHLHSEQENPGNPILLINDSLGTLNCALKEWECHHLNDSFLSQQAIKQNLENNRTGSGIRHMEQIPYPVILIKIPKTLSLLEYQLFRIQPLLTQKTLLIVGGMTRHIHNSTVRLFEQWIGPTKTSLARKKARLILCSPEPRKALPEYNMEKCYSVPGIPEPMVNLPHLFSRERVDPGTALLLESLRPLKENENRIADFGCGNGIIGIFSAIKNPWINVEAVDDSLLAVESALINIRRNNLGKRINVTHAADLISLSGAFNRIISNPPFHQGQKVDTAPTLTFFRQAKEKLYPGGELRIVCNSSLGYHKYLEKIFGNCRTIREKKGFRILTAWNEK